MEKTEEERIKEAKNKLLNSLANKPTTYKIDVLDNSMLPEELKGEKVISMTIKPPTLSIMTAAALETNQIPEEVLKMEVYSLKKSLPYLDNVLRILCIMSCENQDYPVWLIEFLKKNTTPEDVFKMLQECHIKMKSDFFLNSFHIVNTNPMMMNKPMKKD